MGATAVVPNGTIMMATGRARDAAGSDAYAGVSTAVETPAGAPLLLTLSETADPVAADAGLEYILRFGNRGSLARSGATLSLILPPGVTIVNKGGGDDSVPGVVSWNLDTLDSGETGERRVSVTVNGSEPLVRMARAVLASGILEARAAAATQVGTSPLQLSIVAQQDPVAAAGLLTYLLTVKNTGPQQAVQTRLSMEIPSGVAACQAITDGGTTPSACVIGRDVLWDLGTLDNNATRTVQVTYRVASAAAGPAGTILFGATRVEDVTGSRARATVGSAVN